MQTVDARFPLEGMRFVQFLVPDTRRADLAAAIKAQCQALKHDAREAEILRFTQEAATTIEGWE